MENELKKELKRYIFLSSGDYILYGFLAILSLAMLFTLASMGPGRIVGGLFLCVFLNIWTVLDMLQFNATLKKYENPSLMELVLADFRVGTFLCSDAICLGENFIIGRYTRNIISYDEIEKIYQHITKQNFAVTKRELRVRLTNGKTKTIARLKPKNENEEEMILAIQIIQRKNPYIQIGYK